MTEERFDVFASHSEKNKDSVRAHVELWKARGLKVFFDEDQAAAAHSLLRHIEDALERSQRVVVFVTPAALTSAWVTYEVELTQKSDLDARRPPRLLPVLLEQTPLDNVWPAVRLLPILDLTHPHTRHQHYAQLARILGIKTDGADELRCPAPVAEPPATQASLENVQETLKAALPTGATRTLDNVRELLQLAYQVWEKFASLPDESEIGRKLDEVLWGWHVRLDVLCKFIIANEADHSVEDTKRAIDYICVNRGELKGFSFPDEPERTLTRIIDSHFAHDAVKQHAKGWLQRIKKVRPRAPKSPRKRE